MLVLQDIKKSFKDKVVLDGVNITVESGSVFGLIGANGAGKTTIMNIISALLTADSGSVKINDKEIKTLNDCSKNIGYIIDIPAMSEYLTSREYLKFLISSQKLEKEKEEEKIETLLKKVGISDAKMLIKHFSRGMKQRLGIAAGLINDPEIILLDEPCSALDPQGRAEVLEIISELKKEGKTILLSTHILSDIEKVCDNVGFLKNGKIFLTGKLTDILKDFKENIFSISCSKEDALKIIDALENNENFVNFKMKNDKLEIHFKEGSKKEIFKAITSCDVEIDSIILKTKTIEDIFLTGIKKEGKYV